MHWFDAGLALFFLFRAAESASEVARRSRRDSLVVWGGWAAVGLFLALAVWCALPFYAPRFDSHIQQITRGLLAVAFQLLVLRGQAAFQRKAQRTEAEAIRQAEHTPMNLSMLNGQKKERNP